VPIRRNMPEIRAPTMVPGIVLTAITPHDAQIEA
jgi:hypothetical protein